MTSDGLLHGQLVDAGPCPYLPDRRFLAFHLPVHAAPYRQLLDHRFRRMAGIAYRPLCEGCSSCIPLRVDVQGFCPRRDQRRAWAAAQDLRLTWMERDWSPERAELYRRYQREVHHDHEDSDARSLLDEDGGVPGGILEARDAAGVLVAFSVCDVVEDVLSSVYCVWEPEERRRRLGTVLALAEIAHARRTGLRWWYSGFWVPGNAKMAYKARFGPAEWCTEAGWRTFTPPPMDRDAVSR